MTAGTGTCLACRARFFKKCSRGNCIQPDGLVVSAAASPSPGMNPARETGRDPTPPGSLGRPQKSHTKESRTMNEKQRIATKKIRNYMWWSMGAGLVPVPFLDLAAIAGVQLKMLSEVAKVYNVPFHESRGKAVIGALVGTLVPQSLACGVVGSALKAIPAVGTIAGASALAVFSGASAWALGNVFVQHFEAGGTFLDFDPEAVREYFRAQFEEGKKMAASMEAEQSHATQS